VHRGGPEVRQFRLTQEHDVGGNKGDGKCPGDQDADGHEDPEHLDRRDGRQGQRGEARRHFFIRPGRQEAEVPLPQDVGDRGYPRSTRIAG